jgi:hypothetical protein
MIDGMLNCTVFSRDTTHLLLGLTLSWTKEDPSQVLGLKKLFKTTD